MVSKNSRTEFSTAPIIVVGANHSGTRGITDVLSKLGSDPGKKIVGPYSENEFFLRMTQEMIQSDSGKGWLDSIYDIEFIKNLKDDLRWVPVIRERMESEFGNHFDDIENRVWHWKCPSASLYLNTWKEIFPHAFVIHLERDDYAVAESLFRRMEQLNPISAVRFNRVFNDKIESMIGQFDRRIKLKYDEVYNQRQELIDFLPSDKLDLSNVEAAFERFVIYKRALWSSKRKLKTNVWRVFARIAVRMARLLS